MVYLGVRVTLDPEAAQQFVRTVFGDRNDVFWGNHPAHTDDHPGASAAHAHIVVPFVNFAAPTGKKIPGFDEKEALRKRIQRLTNLKGNAQMAISIYTNDLVNACTYFKHSEVEFHGSKAMRAIFDSAPNWVESRPHLLTADTQDDIHVTKPSLNMRMLNEQNIIQVMQNHVRKAKLQGKRFEEVLAHLLKNTRWMIGPALRRERICYELIERFRDGPQACGEAWAHRYLPNQYKSELQNIRAKERLTEDKELPDAV